METRRHDCHVIWGLLQVNILNIIIFVRGGKTQDRTAGTQSHRYYDIIVIEKRSKIITFQKIISGVTFHKHA
jgi:hypothetical protein